MRIALIHCPYEHKAFSENLKAVDEEFCLAPPIILAYVAAILEKTGHNVRLIDAHALRITAEDVLKSLSDFKPDIVGFRLENYHFHTTLGWITFLKKHLNVPILVGGVAVTLYPHEVMSYPQIDYGIVGDALESLPALLKTIENRGDPSGVKGIIIRRNGKIEINSCSIDTIDFNLYPFPARHLLQNNLYCSFISQRKNFTIMVTARGCLFNCAFCAIKRIPYQERAVDNVIREIEQCYYDFHIREIDFFDATFFLNKTRAIALCKEIQKKKLKIEWSCRSRVDVVDEEILREASQSGCRQIYYGIESVNPPTLKYINKQITLKQVKKAVSLTKKYGMRTMGFFMIGNPGDTKESIEQTIHFAKKSGLDFIQVCRTIAKPNTDLNDMAIAKTGRDFWKEYILNQRLEENRIPIPWKDLTQKEIEHYTKKAYYSFYFRPLHILKILMKAKSLQEVLRYFKVGCKMLFKNNPVARCGH